LAGFTPHRRRGNGERSPVHAKYSPAAATLPRPILHGKQEDDRIYLVFAAGSLYSWTHSAEIRVFGSLEPDLGLQGAVCREPECLPVGGFPGPATGHLI